MGVHWMRPEWLWTLVPALILLVLLWRQRSRTGSWQSVIAPELLRHLVSDDTVSRGRNLLPLVLLGWLIAALAAAGPSWQKIPQPVHQKQDALVVLLDLSFSMNSADLAPSRLDRARQKLLDLLQERQEGQTGLIAYAGDAHIVTPLTDDTATIANLLPALNPEMMPLPGSEPVSAVTQGLDLLRSAGIRGGKILLVTDGVSEQDRAGIKKVLAGSEAQLSIMGVGTATGAPIPLPGGGFIKDASGTIVMPGLEEQGLRELAADTGGTYRRMQINDSDLQSLLAERPLDDTEELLSLDRTADTWEDQGYFLILALLPFALCLFRRGWLLTLVPLILPAMLPALVLLHPQPAAAQTWDDLWLTRDQQGQQALQQGDTEAAAALFENPEWAGTAAYEVGDYEAAAEKFTDPENADSLYNRGNALAKAGELDQAIASYEQSLNLQPDQPDALENLELLKTLKEQQQEQEQEQQNQDQQQDQQENGDQQQSQDQQQSEDQQESQEQQQGEDQQQSRGQQQKQDQQQSGNESQQQDQGEPQDQAESEASEADQGEDESESREEQLTRDTPAESEEGETDEANQQDIAASAEFADTEEEQAMQQWLRRVPDDPSGLLRQKFRYESQQRQQQGVGRDDETYW